MELYRREFEFVAPVIPEDDAESSDGDNEQTGEEQYQGKNEVINGIEIQTHSMTSPEIEKLSRKKSVVAKAEETKINFFS